MKDFSKIVLFGFVIFFFSWLLVYKIGINKLTIQSEDALPAMFLPVTIIKEGTFYADTYYEMIRARYPHPDDRYNTRGLTPFYFSKVVESENFKSVRTNNTTLNINYPGREDKHHYISAFPVITGLLAIPIYFFPILLNMPVTWENLAILSHITAALIISLSGGFLYILLKNYFSLDDRKAKLLTYVYLFGTINFASLSQALWQHGTVQLFTILGLLFLFKFIKEHKKLKYKTLYAYCAGFFLGLAVASRPTAVIYWLFLPFLICWLQRREVKELSKSLSALILGLFPPLIFFIWYNQTFYKDISNQGYSAQLTTGWLSSIPEGFSGLWLSPSKGMLIYSPVLIFALVGFYHSFRELIKKKNWDVNLKYLLFMIIVILHTLVLGKWKHWYGGWSYGYRMASDILPFMVLLTVPYIQSSLYEKTKKLFYTLLAISVLVEIHGMIFFDGIWHAAYDDGFEKTHWLWSVKNSEFVFNVRRVLVKLGLLAKACENCLPGR